MKNKKGISTLMATTMIVILALIAIGVVWLTISGYFDEPHLKIMKEELVEKCIIGLKPCEENDNCPFGYNHISYIHSCKNVVERIEVDEIYIHNVEFGNIDYPQSLFCNENEFDCYLDYIKKQELSTEWLEGNCECIERKKEVCSFPRAWLEDCDGNSCCCNSFDCKDIPCNKYKCGDYTIETWGQIK